MPLKLEWLSILNDFFRIPSVFPPSLQVRVSSVLLQKTIILKLKVANDQQSMLNLPIATQYYIFIAKTN